MSCLHKYGLINDKGGEVSENLLNLKPQGETHGERVTEQEEPDTDQHEQRVKVELVHQPMPTIWKLSFIGGFQPQIHFS